MDSKARKVIGSILLLVAVAHSQTTIQVPPAPVTPGVPFTVVLTNNTGICIDILAGNVLTLLQPGGELIAPELVGCGPVAFCLTGGQSTNLTYAVPTSGPGSSGSYLLLCPYGSGAAARLDVVGASPGFPDIHTYPPAMPHGPGAHQYAPPPSQGPEWEFANTANLPRVISPSLSIYTPGGSIPVATLSFPALTIPAGGVTRVGLPLAGLALGPYTVEASWNDPAIGPTTGRHGIQISSATALDLHFPGGRVLAPGGSIPARIAVNQPGFFSAPTWSYALAVGFLPGSTALPGGTIVPLVPDALVLASLANGIGGLLTGHVGTTTSQGVYCAHGITSYPVATGMVLAHPGPPALLGLTLRVAVFALDPATGTLAASQPEEITLL